MLKQNKGFFTLAIGSNSFLFIWSLLTYILYRTMGGIYVIAAYFLLPFALIGIVLTIFFSVLFSKSNCPNYTKINLILLLVFFTLATISASVFIVLSFSGLWWYSSHRFESYKTHIAIAIVVPTLFLIATTICTILYLLNKNHCPTKTDRMQTQIDELQKQINELKKGD